MGGSFARSTGQTPSRRERDASMNWAARLSEHRAKIFVGRVAELGLLRHALQAEHPNFQVLAIYGPPGSGKTTLLKRFATECDDVGVGNKLIDARSLQPVQKPFLRAFRAALELGENDVLTTALARRGRFILMIDNYDTLYPLHDWLCETVLPQLPASTIFVVASREALPDLWRTDPAWRQLVQPVYLHNFSPKETRMYLTLRAVPGAEHGSLIRFSRGHPLALSLAADLYDQRSDFSFDPRSAPDMMQTLVRRFVGDVVDPGRRMALEASAIVRVTTEAVLAAMLDSQDVRAEFEWLCDLSFIDFSPAGIYPHDLVRDAISQDLLWRDAHRYEELRRRAHEFYAPLLRHPDQNIQEKTLVDYLFLYRSHAALRPFLERHGTRPVLPKAEQATPADHPQLLALVRHFEGEASADVLAHWLRYQPQGAWLMRGDDGRVTAFTLIVRLDGQSEAHTRADPLTRRIWEYLQKNDLLQPNDVATVSRFVIDAEKYQDITPQIASFAMFLLRHCLTVPNLKFTFNILAQPEVWEPFATASGFFKLVRDKDLQFQVGERRMGVFMQDWRCETPEMWLSRIAPQQQWERQQRESTRHRPISAVQDEQQLLEQRNKFASAVRHALKNFHVLDALASNPLVNSAFVRKCIGENADSDSKTRALQAAITEVVEFLGTVPTREKLYQALRYTYIEPQGSQERVAEWLGIPFSTYRGHLRAGMNVLTDILWRKDVEARG